jgi:hypothetical protein
MRALSVRRCCQCEPSPSLPTDSLIHLLPSPTNGSIRYSRTNSSTSTACATATKIAIFIAAIAIAIAAAVAIAIASAAADTSIFAGIPVHVSSSGRGGRKQSSRGGLGTTKPSTKSDE